MCRSGPTVGRAEVKIKQAMFPERHRIVCATVYTQLRQKKTFARFYHTNLLPSYTWQLKYKFYVKVDSVWLLNELSCTIQAPKL